MSGPRLLGLVLVVAVALLLLLRRGGGPALEDPGLVRAPSEADPARDARWFPLVPGRRWRYAVSGGADAGGTVEYRCRRVGDGVYAVFEHSVGASGERLDDIGELAPGAGDSWVYRKGHQRGARRWVFLPPDPAPGVEWEVRPGLRARVVTRDDQLEVRYERETSGWARTRWFRRGVGIVREESPAEQGMRVLRLIDGKPIDP